MTTRALQLERPLVAFDLETTGLSVVEDRIVEISCVKIHPSGKREVRTRRINPQRPISAEAALIHGIGDEDVQDAPTFRQVARGLHEFLEGCDLTGFNLTSFDLPMLKREFERAGLSFPPEGTRVIDSRKIYVFKEPRSLAAAYQYYCGKELAGAHSAEADAVAAADVLLAQVQKYDDLPEEIGALDDFCHPGRDDWVDAEGKLVWSGDEAAVGFGKYRGVTLRELAQDDPNYLRWIAKSDFPRDVVEIVLEALEGQFRQRTAA